MHGQDWLILAAYCALLIVVALYFRKRANRSVEGYFLADRNLPWWVIGLSDSAAYTGGGQGFLMVIFLGGFSGLWLMAWVTWSIWMPLVAVLWAPMWRRLGVVTSGQLIERRYGGRAARRFRNVFAVYACLAWGLTVLAYVAAWMAATLAPILGWSGGQVLAVFGGVTIMYLMVSGFFAVAYNDVIQFFLLLAGNMVFAMMLLAKAGGLETAWQKIVALRGPEFLSPLPWSSQLTGISLLALCVQGLFFAGSPYAGEGWTAQRYLAARSERHAVAGQIFNGFLALVVRLIPFVIMGLAAAALFPVRSIAVPAELWGQLVKQYAPPGLFGLLLVGGLGGYMATISSVVNWAAGYLMNDLYRLSIRPKASSREYLWMSRLFSALLLMAALVWGAAIEPVQLDRWVLFINSALVVFPLPLAWLKWFWWRTNVYGEMAGILGAFPASYIVWFGWKGWVPAFGDLERYPFWLGFSILFGLGWTAILTATLFTRPESMEVLRDFYRTVRPIGFWGPVRESIQARGELLPPQDTWRDLRACASGVVFHFLMSLAFFSLFAGRWSLAAASLAGMVVSGALFARTALARRLL